MSPMGGMFSHNEITYSLNAGVDAAKKIGVQNCRAFATSAWLSLLVWKLGQPWYASGKVVRRRLSYRKSAGISTIIIIDGDRSLTRHV